MTQKYDEAMEDLRRAKEEDIERFERDFEEQPQELANEISEQFGFSYVE